MVSGILRCRGGVERHPRPATDCWRTRCGGDSRLMLARRSCSWDSLGCLFRSGEPWDWRSPTGLLMQRRASDFLCFFKRVRGQFIQCMDSRVSLDHSKRASRRGAQNRERRRAYRLTGSRAWSFIALLVVVVSFLFVPSENKYAGALAGAFAFLFVQVFLPSCRPVSGRLLCPWNWALFVFFLQLVLLPSSLLWFGPSRGVLPFLPSDRAINLAMLINVAAFVTFCATYQYFAYHSKVTRHPGKLLQLSGPDT